jgi:hypothetical protein
MKNGNLIALHGHVLEDLQNHLFESDVGGTKGFSGTGYYINGKLGFIHKGQGQFDHSQDEKAY